jgi:hypothetical protein
MSGKEYPSMRDITITEEGVQKLLERLNPKKACGPDNLTARFLKDISQQLAPLLTAIFQRSLNEGKVPEDWKTANVTAIFKKGDRFKPSNYRPVSLTCISCKLLEHILVSNILNHLDDFKILVDCQHVNTGI